MVQEDFFSFARYRRRMAVSGGVRKDIDDLYFGIFVGQWVIFQGVWRSEEAKGLRCKEPEGKEIFVCKVVYWRNTGSIYYWEMSREDN